MGGDHGAAAFPGAIHVAAGVARAEAELGEELVLLFRERPHRSIDPAKAQILIFIGQREGELKSKGRSKRGCRGRGRERMGGWAGREGERRRCA